MDPQRKIDLNWVATTRPFSDDDREARTVVHFWANWNGYDRDMDNLVATVRSEYEPEFRFRSCEVDREENFPLARAARVLNLPALSLVVNGEPRETVHGLRSESDLRVTLNRWRYLE